MRLRVGPLPASQVVTAALICTGRTIGIRTCGGAGQIALLRLPRARRLAVGVAVARRRQRLPVGAVHGRGRANAAPDGVSGDKGLRLRRDGREDAVLVEAQAVGTAAVLGGLEARAADLAAVSTRQAKKRSVGVYLAAAAVAAGNGSALAGCRRLVVLLDVLRRRLLLAVWILLRRGACPLVGAGQTVLLLVLRVLVGSHVRARLLRRGRRKGGVDLGRRLGTEQGSSAGSRCWTYMRGRRRIGAVGRLLARRRLPVGGHLALAGLVRVHGEGGGLGEGWVKDVEAWGKRPTTWCCRAVTPS